MPTYERDPNWISPFETNTPEVPKQEVAPNRGRKSIYPWAEWLDMEWHSARYGVDFTCSLGSFRSYLYNYALGHHLLVRVEIVSKVDRIVRFCFWPLDDAAYE